MASFGFGSKDISEWKSTGIYNYSSRSNMNALANSKIDLPNLKNDGRMHVHVSGNHFQQNKVIIPNNNNVINIYCVYQLDPIASTRDTSYTIQNALFGAMQITKNAPDYDKNNYKGYGICFDERSQFGHTITENGRAHTTNGRNVLIFGVDMSFSAHATNRANHIYLMGDGLTQGINDTTLYVEKNYWSNFTDVKNVNMQVYNFLMRLIEIRNVLWHGSCKCVCKLNSSVCNNKQIWNDDTCRCDCNEDCAGIINCNKGYMWNPSTCECQCDTWCKQGQYLDHKNCVCKNKLLGRVIEECTRVINETMINN